MSPAERAKAAGWDRVVGTHPLDEGSVWWVCPHGLDRCWGPILLRDSVRWSDGVGGRHATEDAALAAALDAAGVP